MVGLSHFDPIEINTYGPTFFTCVPPRRWDSLFVGEKLVLVKLESSLILFYFKRENKTRKKTLKNKWLHSFGKACLRKTRV